MASRRKYRITWQRWLRQYTRSSAKEFNKSLLVWSDLIPWNDLKLETYHTQIKTALDPQVMSDTLNSVYFNVGLRHGLRVGKGINKELKQFTMDAFTPRFINELNFYLQKYGLRKVTSIESTYFEKIIRLFQVRLDEGMTIEQAQREIRKIVQKPSFNRSQALRIARTESTAAANFAATQASRVSGFVMEKEWISALDARTRRPPEDRYDHYDMNGVRVREHEAFIVTGESMMYPGDPNGSAGNVINCRCAVAVVPARDKQGNLIPTN